MRILLLATLKCSAKSSTSLSLALPFSGGAETATSSIPSALTETPSLLADGLTFTVTFKANSLPIAVQVATSFLPLTEWVMGSEGEANRLFRLPEVATIFRQR